jgi:hypothetical protein
LSGGLVGRGPGRTIHGRPNRNLIRRPNRNLIRHRIPADLTRQGGDGGTVDCAGIF